MSSNLEQMKIFFQKEKNWLGYLQVRFEDEWKYEEPEEFKNAIKLKAQKYGLNVVKVKMNFNNFSIKITIEFDDKKKGYIDILKTKFKISSSN